MVSLSLLLLLLLSQKERVSLLLCTKKGQLKARRESLSGLGSSAVTLFIPKSEHETRVLLLWGVKWKKKCVSSPRVVVFPPKEVDLIFSGKPTTWLPLDSVESCCNPKKLRKGMNTLNTFFFQSFFPWWQKNEKSREKRLLFWVELRGVVSGAYQRARESERENE